MNKKELIYEGLTGETVEYNHADWDYSLKCGDIEVVVSAYYGYITIKEKGKQKFYMEFEGGRRR